MDCEKDQRNFPEKKGGNRVSMMGFRRKKSKRTLDNEVSWLPYLLCGFLAFIAVWGTVRMFAKGEAAFASALQIERHELSTGLFFLNDNENLEVDSNTPYYTEIRTRDEAVLWRSDQVENPQTDAWFGLIGDVSSYLENNEKGVADRYFVSSYYDELFRNAEYSIWTGLKMPDRIYRLTLYNSLQNEVAAWMNEHRIEGSIFAYDVRSGDIFCMASTPNIYINKNTYIYTPGSTMKLITLLLAVDQGLNLDELSFVCEGKYALKADGQIVKCTGTHGRIGTAEALGRSCNCFFAQLIEQLDYTQAAQTLQKLGVLVNETGFTTLGKIRREKSNVFFSSDMSATFNNVFQLIGQDSGRMSPIDMSFFTALFATNGTAAAPRLLVSDAAQHLDFGIQNAGSFEKVFQFWKEGYQKFYTGYSELITAAKTGTASNLGDNNRKQRTLCLWSEPLQMAAYIVIENYDDSEASLADAANYLVERVAELQPQDSRKE